MVLRHRTHTLCLVYFLKCVHEDILCQGVINDLILGINNSDFFGPGKIAPPALTKNFPLQILVTRNVDYCMSTFFVVFAIWHLPTLVVWAYSYVCASVHCIF